MQSIIVGDIKLSYSPMSAGWITPNHHVIRDMEEARQEAARLDCALQQRYEEKWAPYETRFMRDVAGTMSLEDIANKLERTQSEVRRMAREFGLTLTHVPHRREAVIAA